MFERLNKLPDDPILGLIRLFREDTAAQKVDLGAGVYQDEAGHTPILHAVKDAERQIFEHQHTKTYEGLAGNPKFNTAVQKLIFGDDHAVLRDGRVATVQTTGGSGGLHIAALVIGRASPEAKVWVSIPTWPNHEPLLASAGMHFERYPYYDSQARAIDFEAMLDALSHAARGDVVLLHGSCHNPTGADLEPGQWDVLVDLLEARGLIPFIDLAYQGFAVGVEEDGYGARLCASRLPESLVVSSCSKTFGLYRERVGSASIVAASRDATATSASHLANVTRRVYSMPPAHGAAIVAQILNDPQLRARWQTELAQMRDRINLLRRKLSDALGDVLQSQRFEFIAQQHGMFSLLGLTPEQINRLRDQYHVYMVSSSRANIAGVSDANLMYLRDAFAAVINDA